VKVKLVICGTSYLCGVNFGLGSDDLAIIHVRHRRSIICALECYLCEGNCSNLQRLLLLADLYKVVTLITKSMHLQQFISISCVLLIDKSERFNSAICP